MPLAIQHLFLGALRRDGLTVRYRLRDVDINYILTEDDARILNDIARTHFPKHKNIEVFAKGQTIIELVAKLERLSALYPSDVLKQLLLSGKLNAEQINYLENYFASQINITGEDWRADFAFSIQQARTKLQQ